MRTAVRLAAIEAICATFLFGQGLSNGSLTGKYFARHVELTTDANNNATDLRSIVGTITFDGAGNYSFTGQQVIGSGTAASYSAAGTYSVNSAGLVTLTNPQKSTLTLNARFGSESLIGSSTEAAGNVFDLFAAIPAPSGSPAYSNSTLSTSWNLTDFELPGASTAQVRDSAGIAQFDGAGNISLNVQGHGAGIAGGANQKQKSYTGTYTVNADGSGTIAFVPPVGFAAPNTLLGGGARVLGVSASGHMLLGGTAGSHDLLIGVRAAATDNLTPASFSGRYWVSGIEVDAAGVSPGVSQSYAGSASANSSSGAVIIAERLHQSATPNYFYQTSGGNFTTVNSGAGAAASSVVLSVGSVYLLPGAGSTLVAAEQGVDGSGNPTDQNKFAIALAEQIPTLTGAGVFVNPQGVVNAASYAPVGNPISPGEFIGIYGSGLASQTAVATPPYPSMLGNVSVSIGGLPAPIYVVSSGQINCLVPYGVNTANASTSVVVSNNGVNSNTVSVPLSQTSPGIFSNNLSGLGDGAITHLNNTLVSASSPAVAGETLVVYLTGLGALQNAIKDGNAPNPPAADSALATVQVAVDGVLAPSVLYAGINPVYPGLYQINFQMPQVPDHGSEVPVTIATPDAIHQQITLFAQ